MNLRNVLIIALFFSPLNKLLAQYIPMVEEGKFWIYQQQENQDFWTPISGFAITFLGDTIINSLSYKKVYQLNLKGEHCSDVTQYPCWDFDIPYQAESKQLISFIREDTVNRQVYNLPISNNGFFCDFEEYLMMDFSSSIGDTLNDCVYESIGADNTSMYSLGIVDSINVVEAFDKPRNTIFTTGLYLVIGLPAISELYFHEGVGINTYGLFYRSRSVFYDFCEGEMDQCNLILSQNSIDKNKQINIFPNPSKGIFQISMEEEKIELIKVYSLLGELKSEFQNSNDIDISDFPKGVYFLEIITKNNERLINKILKEN